MHRLVVAAGLLLAACTQGNAPAGSSTTPVILISVDTLRADRLPMYGYRKVTTPALDALRQDSILYRNAYAHCPLTLPSHATVFTGQLPAEAGVRDNIGYTLAEEAETLAELLAANGYATGGAISSYVMRAKTGLAQGFEFYEDSVEISGPNMTIGRIQRDGKETIEASRAWITEQTRPLFFFLHLYEPHTPYAAPEPYASRYSDAYDGEVAYSDELVGRFLGLLKESGIYDRALIIFFSDHGEGLGDHGEDEHGIFLYREAIHVPLLVKLPRSRSGNSTVETPVQLSDIFPTVLEQTLTTGGRPSAGVASLLGFIGNEQPGRQIYSETWYPRFHFGWNELQSLIDGSHHYIRAPKPELYDLARDPGEKENVLDSNRRIYFRMAEAIEPLLQEPSAPKPVDSEEAAKLAALGYLGSTVITTPGEALPDPKDKIETFRDIQRAFVLIRRHDLVEGLEIVEAILADNPKMVDVWALKSNALASLGRKAEAIEAAKEGLRLSPTASHLALEVANLALSIGRLDEAAQHAELVVTREPGRAWEVLARIWIARGNLDEAELAARKALAGDEERVISLVTLARIEKERGNYEQALLHLDEATRRIEATGNRSVTHAWFLRGDVLARLGRIEEAEAAFRREIELFPESPEPYRNLILLLVADGRTQEGAKLVFQLIEASPTPPAYEAVIDTLRIVGDERGVRYWKAKARERFPADSQFRG
jgi:arylsulfatase A-like enzyme/Flp pilus assembly protein TadD